MTHKRVKMDMTGWYDPGQLIRTGIRVVISTIFGEFSDKREAVAAANAIEPQPFDPAYDYSAKGKDGEFWFDFLADTGDGWDSTLAMARLVSAGTLRPAGVGQYLPRGAAIVLGGDQVYPTATKQAYDDRFLSPFDEAYDQLAPAERAAMPDLYAVPGNHDWYDGLISFLSIFCRRSLAMPGHIGVGRAGRLVAGRATRQTRSYFAIRLPGNWWLWGTDSQLSNYVDQPQIEFFNHVARHWMAPKSKLILCVGQPHWAYVDCAHPDEEFESFSYLERLCGTATADDGTPMGHDLKLVLTGDSHHYSRYVEHPIHYVTCGGGGAFLHPTHQLRSKSFQFKWPQPGTRFDRAKSPYTRSLDIATKAGGEDPAVYPDKATSARQTWRNLLFAGVNPKFTTTIAAVFVVMLWLLDFTARETGYADLAATQRGAIGDGFRAFSRVLGATPVPVIVAAALLFALTAFAKATTRGRRVAKGAAHFAGHLGIFVAISTFGLRLTADWWRWPGWETSGAILSVVTIAAVAALCSATLFGLYLLFNLQLWGQHWNEAFSSLRIKHFKSFLRLRIDASGGLTLFPIGLERVPGRADASLRPHLIEDPVLIG